MCTIAPCLLRTADRRKTYARIAAGWTRARLRQVLHRAGCRQARNVVYAELRRRRSAR